MESASQDYAPARPARRKLGTKWIIILVVLLIAVTGGIFFMSNQGGSSEEEITPTPVQLPTEVPTPEITESASPSATPATSGTPSGSPAPTRKASIQSAKDMNIQIQNGSGAEGVASQARDFLKSKGYAYFETGNADNYDYSGTTVKVKSSLEKYAATLKKDLSEKYTLASGSASLPDDSLFDAVVIVGK